MTTVRDLRSTSASRGTTVLPAMVLAVAGYQVNATMLTPALPDLMERLAVGSGLAGLAQTLFFLLAAVGQVTLTRMSDYWGRRRMLLATLSVLIVGEIVCATAPNIGIFIAGRLIQGVSAATFSLAYLIMHEFFSPARFGRALGIVTATNGGIAGFDAVIGGSIADLVGFRGVFAISLVLSLIALWAVYRTVPETPIASRGTMDWRGVALLAAGLTGIVLGLNQSGKWGWDSPATLGLLLAGLILLVGFLLAQRHSRDAVIDVSTLASRGVWPLLLTTTFTLAAAFGLLNFTIPLLAQTPDAGFGMSATLSALLFLTPASALGLVVAPIAGHFAPRFGWRRSVLLGSVGTTAVLAVLAIGPTSMWLVGGVLALLGITYTGYGLTTLTGLAVRNSPADKPGALPGLNGACFGVGASMGIAVASGAVTTFAADGPTQLAFRAALLTALGFGVLALVSSLFIAKESAEHQHSRAE
ncbi:Major Facilitator Superfamily protein [Actinopolyspora lacussalsi subsp. righensis]|uniref:Major Facilitator Superfamily protein n=1 Tax=Actinopolyspora righensis TaxID=995060 RepID=A0A1I6X6W2_9ACTN|nr:MFS transporter [Actinopolyspora righensis]SFT34128.1 Major Facilitator Superfamily protein [Actinopolyspora righensis]